MVGEDATIKIGSDVAGAMAGIFAVKMAMRNMDKTVLASAAIMRKGALIMSTAFVGIGLTAGGGVAIGMKKATNAYEEFEQSTANAASVAGALGDEFTAIKENVAGMSLALGRVTKFTAANTAAALYDVASAGIDVGNMVKEDFKPAMDLAAGTQSELARTTHWVTSTMGQFKVGMEEAGHISDVFAKTIGSSKATLAKIGLAFVYTGGKANDYGDTMEDTLFLLGLMFNAGLRGEQAGRGLGMSYAKLASPTARAAKTIKELGLTLEEVSPAHNTMITILERLHDAQITATQADIIFGQEAGKSMNAAIGGIKDVELYAKIIDNEGFAAVMAAQQLDTLSGQHTILKSAVEVLSIEIGKFSGYYLKGLYVRLIKVVGTIIDKVTPAFEYFQGLIKDLSPAFAAVAFSIESFKGIVEDLGGASSMTAFFLDKMIDSINFVAVSLALFLRYVDDHPKLFKFALAVMFAATAFAFLIPIINGTMFVIGALTPIISGIGVALGVLATFLVTGFIPAWVGAWFAALGPITLVAVAIAILGTMWVFNTGGIRDSTASMADDVIGILYQLGKGIWGAAYVINLGINEIRKALGMEENDLSGVYMIDEDTFAERFKAIFKRMMPDSEKIFRESGFDIFAWMDQSETMVEWVAKETAAYEARCDAIAADTAAMNDNILAKGKYGNIWSSGQTTSQMNAAFSYERSGGSSGGDREYAKEGANAARDRGEIKPGDTYFIIDKINTKSDVDDLDARMGDAVAGND